MGKYDSFSHMKFDALPPPPKLEKGDWVHMVHQGEKWIFEVTDIDLDNEPSLELRKIVKLS